MAVANPTCGRCGGAFTIEEVEFCDRGCDTLLCERCVKVHECGEKPLGPMEQGVVKAMAAQAPLEKYRSGRVRGGIGEEIIDTVHLKVWKQGDYYYFGTLPEKPWRGVALISTSDPLEQADCVKEAEAFALRHHARIEWH